MESLMDNIVMNVDYDEREMTLRRINWLEQHDKDIIDQPFFELVGLAHQLIQNKGGVFMINGRLCRHGQDSPTTPETLPICRVKYSYRVWLGHSGQWAVEVRYRYNRLNIGSFTTVEVAVSAYELIPDNCVVFFNLCVA
ncbi:hypothetical protein RHGRI_003608 [Rhododendron griersonianum]|uniref:Uncharacterized protein n=1 Tax=Rhododendron griersonianum TaxID=479676 RepID=A0AAV6L6W1_9ERIC|nr:hypothetical protein RHGRI_003608 [Rhododendron griersonianum]